MTSTELDVADARQVVASEPVVGATVMSSYKIPATKEERINLFNAIGNAVSLDDQDKAQLEIAGVTQRNGRRTDPTTGEDQGPCIDTILIGVDGKGYFSKSAGIARTAAALPSMFGNPNDPDSDWPIWVEVMETELAGKRKLKSLKVVQAPVK